MTTELIEEKIRKLLALASNNPSKEESASALAKAQALMTEHKIEQATLNISNKEEEEIFTEFGETEGITSQNWKYTLSEILSRANGCFIYTLRHKGTIGVVGKPSNVKSFSYLLLYCVNEVERIAKANCRGLGRAYAISFKHGCVQAISLAITLEKQKLEAMMRARAAATNDARGLVVLNNAISKINAESALAEKVCRSKMKLSKGTGSGRISSNSGYSAGQQAGSSIYPGSSAKIGSNSSKRLN